MSAKLQCAFCYPREHGRHGEVVKAWFADWNQFVPLCELHLSQASKSENIPASSITEPGDWKD